MKVVQTSVTEAPVALEVYGLQALVAAPEIEALNVPKIEAINATEVEFSKPEAPAPQVELLVSVGGDDGILCEVSYHYFVEHVDICKIDKMVIEVHPKIWVQRLSLKL